MAFQITGVSAVYSTVCSCTDQRKHQSSASLAFVRGIHRRPVSSPQLGNYFHLMKSLRVPNLEMSHHQTDISSGLSFIKHIFPCDMTATLCNRNAMASHTGNSIVRPTVYSGVHRRYQSYWRCEGNPPVTALQ